MGLIVLTVALLLAVMVGITKTQKLEGALKQNEAKTSKLQQEVKASKKVNADLKQRLTTMTQLKTGYVIDGMSETVKRFFGDAFTFKADVDDYAKRKADATGIAAPSVVNQFFTEDESIASQSPSFVDSEAQDIKVYIENTRNSITTGIVTYTLNNKVGTTIDKNSVMYYQFTYDATLNQLLSAERMERFVPNDN